MAMGRETAQKANCVVRKNIGWGEKKKIEGLGDNSLLKLRKKVCQAHREWPNGERNFS